MLLFCLSFLVTFAGLTEQGPYQNGCEFHCSCRFLVGVGNDMDDAAFNLNITGNSFVGGWDLTNNVTYTGILLSAVSNSVIQEPNRQLEPSLEQKHLVLGRRSARRAGSPRNWRIENNLISEVTVGIVFAFPSQARQGNSRAPVTAPTASLDGVTVAFNSIVPSCETCIAVSNQAPVPIAIPNNFVSRNICSDYFKFRVMCCAGSASYCKCPIITLTDVLALAALWSPHNSYCSDALVLCLVHMHVQYGPNPDPSFFLPSTGATAPSFEPYVVSYTLTDPNCLGFCVNPDTIVTNADPVSANSYQLAALLLCMLLNPPLQEYKREGGRKTELYKPFSLPWT